jgi:hypothetical protein
MVVLRVVGRLFARRFNRLKSRVWSWMGSIRSPKNYPLSFPQNIAAVHSYASILNTVYPFPPNITNMVSCICLELILIVIGLHWFRLRRRSSKLSLLHNFLKNKVDFRFGTAIPSYFRSHFHGWGVEFSNIHLEFRSADPQRSRGEQDKISIPTVVRYRGSGTKWAIVVLTFLTQRVSFRRRRLLVNCDARESLTFAEFENSIIICKNKIRASEDLKCVILC